MGKKKKEHDEFDEDCFNYEDDDEELEEESSLDDLPENDMDFDDNDLPSNPMGLAYYINKESDTAKYFKELPRESKYSFLDREEAREVKHFAKSYRDWKYIEKIIDLRIMEDKKISEVKMNIKDIKSKEQLVKYLEDTNRDYLIHDIDDLEKEEIQKILTHIQKIKPNYFMQTNTRNKEHFEKLYDSYNIENEAPKYIDDMGNVGRVVTNSIVSMGHKGNAAQHSVMTINAVKNEDIEKKAEDKSSFSFLDAIKKRIG